MTIGFWVLSVVVVGPELWLWAHALNPASIIIRQETMDSHVLLPAAYALNMSLLLLTHSNFDVMRCYLGNLKYINLYQYAGKHTPKNVASLLYPILSENKTFG